MQKLNNEYWLVIEPYVYISFKKDSILLYNTLDRNTIETSNKHIIELLSQIQDNYIGVVLISNLASEKGELHSFITELREKFMGDIIDKSFSGGKPMQFSPVLNLQNEINRLKPSEGRSVGENILTHLHEISLFLEDIHLFPNKYYPHDHRDNTYKNKEHTKLLKFNLITKLFSQISANSLLKVNIIMQDIFSYSDFKNLVMYFNKLPVQKKYVYHYDNSIDKFKLELFEKEKSSLIINVDFPISGSKFESVLSLINHANVKNEFCFLISSDDDFALAEQLITIYNILHYTYTPIYNEQNREFFKKNVYLTKEDLLEQPIAMREIFIHQSLNIDAFGKLSMIPSGDFFSNIFLEKLGNISEKTLLEIVYTEVDKKKHWFKVRDTAPCTSCHYQWLCPPPSVYEYLLNKSNLCLINN